MNTMSIQESNPTHEASPKAAGFKDTMAELDAWSAEDQTFMELAAKQEALKRDLAAVAIPSYSLEKPKNTHEELREDIAPTLGAYANVAALGAFGKIGDWYQRMQQRNAERQLKYAAKETDSTGERIYKSFQRGRNKILGGVAAVAALGVEGVLIYHNLSNEIRSPLKRYNYDTMAHSVSYEFGGRGDPNASMVMDAKRANGQLRHGVNYIGVDYPATIAPVDAGPSLEQSTDMGAEAAFQDYLSKKNSGQDFYADGFSEGSIAALKLAKRVKDDNGGTLPDNFHVILEGSPVTSTGFFRSSTAQNPMLKPLLQAAGIDVDTGQVPAGTIARYSQNDVWANGANQSLLGQGVMTLDMQNSHVIQNPNRPHVVWIDAEGVRHEEYDVGVHPFTQMIETNNGVPVNDGFNQFFQDIVPINSNVNGSELAKPNGRAAAMDLARGIDIETGNTGIPQKVMAAVPESFHNVIQDGLDLANTAPDKIMQDPSKIGEVINDVNNMVGDVFKALPSPTNTPVQDFAHGVIQNVVPPEFQQTANDIVTQVFQQLPPAPQIQQPAPLPVPAAPAPAPDLNQLANMANDFIGGLFAPQK